MKMPLRFEFGTEADVALDDGSRLARREAKTFLENLESSSLMGNIDPDEIAHIATAGMELAAAKFSGHSKEDRDKATGLLIIALDHLKKLEHRMAELRSEIRSLERQIDDLESDYEQLNSELQDINEMLDPAKGGEGAYDRERALQILELSSRSDMSDADIQTLLWQRKVAVTEDMKAIESRLEVARNRLDEAKTELTEINREAATLRERLDQAETPDDIPEIQRQKQPAESHSSQLDEQSYHRDDNVAVETSAPNAIGGF